MELKSVLSKIAITDFDAKVCSFMDMNFNMSDIIYANLYIEIVSAIWVSNIHDIWWHTFVQMNKEVER